MQRYDEALADLNRAIELDPSYAWAIGRRGETYQDLERYDEALADLNRAIELDPSYAWAIGHRGETYQDLERYDEALADFNRAIELDPSLAVLLTEPSTQLGGQTGEPSQDASGGEAPAPG
jgi:tetratricopeptide (TPR) repeat protein